MLKKQSFVSLYVRRYFQPEQLPKTCRHIWLSTVGVFFCFPSLHSLLISNPRIAVSSVKTIKNNHSCDEHFCRDIIQKPKCSPHVYSMHPKACLFASMSGQRSLQVLYKKANFSSLAPSALGTPGQTKRFLRSLWILCAKS